MNDKVKKQYPSWVSDGVKYDSCLTDDLDSFFSCLLLEKILGYKITHFYNFGALYRDITYVKEDRQLVGIDMDMVKYNCWGNHVVKSYYNIDISYLSERAKMVLLAVDTTFKMYGFNKANCKRYLVDILELNELYELCEKHKQSEFSDITKELKLYEHIKVNKDGILETLLPLGELEQLFNMSFVLPKNRFKLIKNYKNIGLTEYQYDLKKDELKGRILTKAWTGKYYIKLSYF